MKKSTEFIVNKVKEYYKIPSLSYQEKEFLDYLRRDFPIKNYTLVDLGDALLYTCKRKSPWLVLAHTDRIPVRPIDFDTIGDITLKGQTDNIISVAILRYLAEKNVPINFLLTTKEEVLQSCNQIREAVSRFNDEIYVLDMDIDVSQDYSEIDRGAISLRDRDCSAVYDKDLVQMVRERCANNDVDYITKDGDWLVCQIGTTLAGEGMHKEGLLKNPEIRGMYFGLPIWDYHSNHEQISLRCVDNAVKFFMTLKKGRK